uniref:Uncharacterized protein n=1 Tax=Oncorhynchus tshawytscha TaxID=74940 RepID=A0AAZ3PYG5_ONCTS
SFIDWQGNFLFYVLQLSKKYGSVFTVHFGPTKVVILAGYKTVKQALVNHITFKKSLGFRIEFLILIFLIGKAFDTTQPLSYAVANVISNIVYGSRFEYSDSKFRATVDRANENLRIAGSVSVQLYNMFPWLGPWLKSRKLLLKNIENNKKEMEELVRGLKETLNPQMCRGFVDSFLVRKQTLEV